MTDLTDELLVSRTGAGDLDAFRQLVERNQSAVCGVAYSVLGDFSRSEDVAQEAFVAAWRQLAQLREPGKFKSWVCGIARKVAQMSNRRQLKVTTLDPAHDVPSAEPSPAEQLVRREEEALVWRALADLPETYREPLVLFYREERSVAGVAAALDLSLDATKQRLARGRALLREELTATIETTLARSNPDKALMLGVMAAVTSAVAGVGAASPVPATIGVAGKTAAPLAAKGLAAASMGAWMGTLGGLLGAGFGIWAGDRSTRYPRERTAFRHGMLGVGLITVIFMLPVVAMLAGWWNPVELLGKTRYAIVLIIWQLSFFAATGVCTWRLVRQMKRIDAEETAKGTESHRRIMVNWEGRRWTSSHRFLGLPLVDIQFTSPGEVSQYDVLREGHAFACGWIALGDRACGLFAFGQVAVGGVALGGVNVGAVTLGGLGAGLVSMGGLSAGLLAVGGLAFGGIAFGGVAAGWIAAGGLAFAWRAAKGGVAVAHDFAVGGEAIAQQANTDVAKAYFEDSSIFAASDCLLQFASVAQNWCYPFLLVGCILTVITLATRIAYRRYPA